MANQQLVDYIKKQMEAGYDVNAVEQVLVKAGYAQKDVDKAMNESLVAKDEKEPAIPSVGSGKKLWISVTLFIVIALAVAAYFLWPVFFPPEPAIDEPVIIDEPPVVDEPVNDTTPVVDEPEDVIPDLWVDPPLENATYEAPLLLPDSAFEFSRNESVAITMKVHKTEYIENLQPKIKCDLISDDQWITYPYAGNASFGEQAEVTFVMKGQDTMVFTDCEVEFSTNDMHVAKEPFSITILP